MGKVILKILLVLACTLALFRSTQAADSPSLWSSPYTDRDIVAVPIAIRTEGVPINTASMHITYDKDALVFLSAQENVLVGTHWIDNPIVSLPGSITLSFSIPGGVSNTYDALTNSQVPTEIGILFFQKKTKDQTKLSIDTISAYYNTPTAERATVVSFSKSIDLDHIPVKAIAIGKLKGPRLVATPIVLIRQTFLYKEYAVYVQAVDASGISNMYIRSGDAWQPAANPFVFKAGFFGAQTVIRVYNGKNLFTEREIFMPGIIPSQYKSYFYIILGTLTVLLVIIHTLRKRKDVY